jgi:hypothetical protein
MPEKISMNINDTLELDYIVEQISENTINITNEPDNSSLSIDHIKKKFGVFDPSETGIYELDINGQTVEIEVIEIPNRIDYRWPIDEGSGSIASPDKGNVDLSLSDTVWRADSNALSGYYLDHDGNNDLTTSAQDIEVNQQEYAFAGWFDFQSLKSGTDFAAGFVDDDNYGWRLSVDTDGSSIRLAHVDNSYNVVVSFGTLSINTPYFIAISGSGNSATVYLYDNSQLLNSASGSGSRTTTTTAPLSLGGNTVNSNRQEVDIDAPATSASQLSQSEIETYWESTKR